MLMIISDEVIIIVCGVKRFRNGGNGDLFNGKREEGLVLVGRKIKINCFWGYWFIDEEIR